MKYCEFIALCVITAIGLTGCGGGGSPGGGGATALYEGKVLDGYLQGAKVCFDSNRDLVCDSGEINTRSDTSGHYQLEVPEGSDGQIVVEVEPEVIDSDSGLPVGLRYTMLAPPGNHAAITPLTTLIAIRNQSYSYNQPIDRVVEDMKIKTGMEADFMSDYIATHDEALHRLGQVVAIAMAKKMAALQSMRPALSKVEIVGIASDEIDMSAVKLAADDPSNQTEGRLDLNKIAASHLCDLNINKEQLDARDQRQARSKTFEAASPISAQELFIDGHFNKLTNSLDSHDLALNRLHIANGLIEAQQDLWNTAEWMPSATPLVAVPTSVIRLDETQRKWVEETSARKATILKDGSMIASGYGMAYTTREQYKALDLTGKNMVDWLDSRSLATGKLKLVNPNAVFPAGAKAISVESTQSSGYALTEETAYHQLDEILNLTGGTKGSLGTESFSINFVASTPGATQGHVEYRNYSFLIGIGSWQIKELAGQSILTLIPPPALLINHSGISDLREIYSVYNNKVYKGWAYPETHWTEISNMFNDVAANAIAASLERNAPPNAGIVRIHFSQGLEGMDFDFGVWTISGWQEGTPLTWPFDRLPLNIKDSNGWLIRDLAVAEGATQVSFTLAGSGGQKPCAQDYSYTLPAHFASTRRSDIWVQGCRLEESIFKKTVAFVIVTYGTTIKLEDPNYQQWGVWPIQGFSAPLASTWPDDRVLFDYGGVYSSDLHNAEYRLSKLFPVLEDQTENELVFRVVDKNAVTSCGNDLHFKLSEHPALDRLFAIVGWQIHVDGCTIRDSLL